MASEYKFELDQYLYWRDRKPKKGVLLSIMIDMEKELKILNDRVKELEEGLNKMKEEKFNHSGVTRFGIFK